MNLGLSDFGIENGGIILSNEKKKKKEKKIAIIWEKTNNQCA